MKNADKIAQTQYAQPAILSMSNAIVNALGSALQQPVAAQVSYLFDKYNDKYGADIPVVNIEMMAYGTMNAEKIISAAIEKIG